MFFLFNSFVFFMVNALISFFVVPLPEAAIWDTLRVWEDGMSNMFEIRSICEICAAKNAITDAKNQDVVLTFDREESAIEHRDRLLSKSWELELSILGANYHECPECHVVRPTHELRLFVFRHAPPSN